MNKLYLVGIPLLGLTVGYWKRSGPGQVKPKPKSITTTEKTSRESQVGNKLVTVVTTVTTTTVDLPNPTITKIKKRLNLN